MNLTCLDSSAILHSENFAMHWSFYIFVLCALAGWSIGAMCKAVSQKPSWLFAD